MWNNTIECTGTEKIVTLSSCVKFVQLDRNEELETRLHDVWKAVCKGFGEERGAGKILLIERTLDVFGRDVRIKKIQYIY